MTSHGGDCPAVPPALRADIRLSFHRTTVYALAVALPVVMLLVRSGLSVSFGQRPLLILFMFPIIVSALLGGLGPGLTATLAAAACTAYSLIPPVHSFAIAAGHDALQWGMLITNGVLVSLLSASLHRSRRLESARWRQLAAAHELLRDRESVLKEAQRLAGIGSWTWDHRADVPVWSEEMYRIFGRDPALPPVNFMEIPRYFTAQSWARLSAAVERCMAEGVAYECDAEVVRPDGGHRWVVSRGDAVRDANGAVVELYGTTQDITERKQAEEEIRRLNADLERRVAERTAELTAANRELDSFAYAVSHDLRAPLRAMSGFAQALAEDYGSQLQGEAHVYLEQIGLASRRMGELIDGLLVLSRSTRGDLRRDAVDISALAESLLADLARGDPGRRVAVEVEQGLVARGDASMIEVLMRNLLGNAWKYTEKTAASAIRVCAGEVNGQRGFCVADNGAGFDMAYADRLFQPFQRLHRQDEFPGIGIGLATVQRIVHRHGGEIRAQGRPGAGATFCFTLPPGIPEKIS